MSRPSLAGLLLVVLATCSPCLCAAEDSSDTKSIAAALKSLADDSRVLGKDDASRAAAHRMLSDDLRARRTEANRRDREAWRKITSREEWEKFRDERIAALRRSLGADGPRGELKLRSLRTIEGDGFRIENVVFESRPGVTVTANLYSPAKPTDSMPGMLLCHSHHRPKIDGELQDMGMIFARAGCLVLVMDQLGHGERRQHPFATEKDFDGPFRPSRQDYFFRYNVGMQLHLVGESLIGWMAHDLSRGVDVLLARPGIDPKRIILMGAVAGGGDPAAVAAALDSRITAAVPFNFGGPQPENTYPLPDDAEESFNMFGGGSWESTRNLRRSIGDGFPPWVIVGSLAPRGLIYAHEFSWDRERDPVWKRLETIFGWYDARDRLCFTHGYGRVTLSSNEASHCNHIGAVHRKLIYPTFEKWFGIPAPKDEYRDRREASELLCLPSPGGAEVAMPLLHSVLRLGVTDREAERARAETAATVEERTARMRKEWSGLLGDVSAAPDAQATAAAAAQEAAPFSVERLVVKTEREIVVPILLMTPHSALKETESRAGKRPLVVGVAQAGKSTFLRERADRLTELLKAGIAIALVDVRGTGETAVGSDRARNSAATSLSSSELMHGGTLVGAQLRDLRTALAMLRKRKDIDPARIAIWGDSFAPLNDREVRIPLDAEKQPRLAEPLGHLLALLGGLYEPELAAVVSARGGLVSLASLLESPFPCIPHDALIPGALLAGDFDDLSAAIVPRPMWIGGLVEQHNHPAETPGQEGQRSLLPRTVKASRAAASTNFVIRPDDQPGPDLTAWLIERLK